MDPYELMHSDMKTLRMSVNKVFENWDDNVSAEFGNGCIKEIQSDWNSFVQDTNGRLKNILRAEVIIENKLKKIKEIASDSK